MKLFSNVRLHFWLRRRNTNSKQKVNYVIYCRIFINGEKGDFSTQQQLDPQMWDKSNERVSKKHPNQVILNNLIDELTKEIYDCVITLKSINSDITLNKIKEVVFNKNHTSVTTKREPTIKEISDLYLKELTLKTDIKLLSKETLKGYKSSINKFIIYLKKHKKSIETINDIPKDLYFQFEQFLLQQKGISSNYAHKVIKHCDRMLLYAYKHGWVSERKELQFTVKYSPPKRPILSMEKINEIFNYRPDTPYLEENLDNLKFQLLTGVAYGDLKAINQSNLHYFNGNQWLILLRKKTNVEQKVLLLDQAKTILEKYKNHPFCLKNNQLLPVRSNQKYNKALKEIQSLVDINFKLTSHLARHIFATTVALGNGMNLESLMSTLGHSRIGTTQLYAKVLDAKVVSDFEILKGVLNAKLSNPK
jgi:site-specific recombinase XerD